MSVRCVTVSFAMALLLSMGCRKRTPSSASAPAPVPPPVVADTTSPPPAPSVYDAGSAADRRAGEKDRLFKRWTAAFVRGTPADKGKARAELASQPPELRAEFEKFCQANGVKLE